MQSLRWCPSPVLAGFMQKLPCGSTVIWSCCFVAQECQYCPSQVSATLSCILYLMVLNANAEGFLCCWAQVLLYWKFTALKPDELLILQINCHAGKQDTFFSEQLWRNNFHFLEEQFICVLWYLKSCGFGSWRPFRFSLILISSK